MGPFRFVRPACAPEVRLSIPYLFVLLILCPFFRFSYIQKPSLIDKEVFHDRRTPAGRFYPRNWAGTNQRRGPISSEDSASMLLPIGSVPLLANRFIHDAI